MNPVRFACRSTLLSTLVIAGAVCGCAPSVPPVSLGGGYASSEQLPPSLRPPEPPVMPEVAPVPVAPARPTEQFAGRPMPEVLNVSPAPLAYASVTPRPTRAVAVRPSPSHPARQHVVGPGETLFSIARQRLGDGGRWRDIVQANPGLKPAELAVGQRLVLPR